MVELMRTCRNTFPTLVVIALHQVHTLSILQHCKTYFNSRTCKSHCEDVKALGYPTEIKPFLKSCGSGVSPVIPEQYTKEMMVKVNETVKSISKALKANPAMRSATDAQGKKCSSLAVTSQ